MTVRKPEDLDDVYSIARVLSSLEYSIKVWFDRMKAVQKLRRAYEPSDFAQKTLAAEEKEFKRNWWRQLGELKKFKKEMGLD